MILNRQKRLVWAAAVLALAGASLQATAKPNVGTGTQRKLAEMNGTMRTTAATCKPATAAIDLDINNVRARLMTGGDMWWDIGTAEARYEVPKGTRKNSLFAGSVWIGGLDDRGNLKVAAQTYRQDGNDYWPGPLDNSNTISEADCSEWDQFWKVNRSDINRFRDLVAAGASTDDPAFDVIKQWPAAGNVNALGRSGGVLNQVADAGTRTYAPYIEVGGDPNKYEPQFGDYPNINGDQFIWWVFNDVGNVKQQSQTGSIGLEVQASAFAYSTKDALNDATFYNYRVINRGNLSLDSTYIATWTDADLGFAFDDYIGCDTVRGLGILYNGRSKDGNGEINSYGTQIPMVGVDFFKGPIRRRDLGGGQFALDTLKMEAFTYYNNDFGPNGNPSNGIHIYNNMTGSTRSGQRYSFDWSGVKGQQSRAYGAGPAVKFVYPGDPGVSGEWSECECGNTPADRRFIHSAGPFRLEAGSSLYSENDITIGAIWVSDAGGCPTTSFKKIRTADDLAQDLFNSGFKTTEGPEAPRVVVREMDRKLVFYLMNDPNSNNFQEKYGYEDSAKYRVGTAKSKRFADSLYKFEGYRVFQVRNSEIQPAQIFNERGEVNNDVAIEVFQTDIRNGVSRIINYDKLTEISDTTYQPIIKVNGKDSGIVHSFSIAQDQFATGADKRLVNYRNYYYVAIAYAYNQFAPFDTKNPDNTQEMPYLESSHGAGGTPIPVVAAMPNPANGNMGTVLNADFGSGVTIRRMEGTGNGGNFLQLTPESEQEALTSPENIVKYPYYQPGLGPVNVKVVDPLKIKPVDWELYISGTSWAGDSTRGLRDTATWRLVDVTNGTTIYSERNIQTLNEQILEQYGLSISIEQVVRPGDDQPNGNGYISSDITFTDPGLVWLAGINDQEQRSKLNWIRSGGNDDTLKACSYSDNKYDTIAQVYESMLGNNTFTLGTWAPYSAAATEERAACGFGVAWSGTTRPFYNLQSVDVVFTNDKSKWTRVAVIELQDDKSLAQGGAGKFHLRQHRSWNGDLDQNGNPVYSADPNDVGMSWFPGYAINQETGERLNIVFGEDSWLKAENGTDMIWNPTSSIVNDNGDVLFGGKHYVYINGTRYDEGKAFWDLQQIPSDFAKKSAYNQMMWVGLPRLSNGSKLLPLSQGLIPTETRLRFRVERPYAKFQVPGATEPVKNNWNPLYSFSTRNLAPTSLTDAGNPYGNDKQRLLDQIHAVPNPYYGYTGYEVNRLDTRVRIINLPRRATINVYTLDGSLIRRLEKDNPNVSYIDWDVRNAKGLPIASGMYLMHVNAEGIGETVIRWFGAMRPVDITTY